jgi:hypothetical protein
LDAGIIEDRFWFMTFAEVEREIESKKRMNELTMKERAVMDYTLADLIGRSNARVQSKSNKMPSIYDAYPALFKNDEAKEIEQKKKADINVLRFKAFAAAHNQKFKRGEAINNG